MYSTVREPVPDRHRAEFYFSGSGPRRDKMKKKTEKLNTKLLITVLYSIKIRGGGGVRANSLYVTFYKILTLTLAALFGVLLHAAS